LCSEWIVKAQGNRDQVVKYVQELANLALDPRELFTIEMQNEYLVITSTRSYGREHNLLYFAWQIAPVLEAVGIHRLFDGLSLGPVASFLDR
jgi:hypothetical protein